MTLTEPAATELPEPLPEISLSVTSRSVMHFLDNWDNEDQFDLSAPYQRESVWDDDRRRNLIRSMQIGLPVGSVVVAHLPTNREKHTRVVDGKQRIEALRAFTHNQFTVPGHWFREEALKDPEARNADVTYSDLSPYGVRSFENGQLGCIEFDSTSQWLGRDETGKAIYHRRSEDEMLAAEADLYNLINFGGVPQTEADKERAERVADDHRG